MTSSLLTSAAAAAAAGEAGREGTRKTTSRLGPCSASTIEPEPVALNSPPCCASLAEVNGQPEQAGVWERSPQKHKICSWWYWSAGDTLILPNSPKQHGG